MADLFINATYKRIKAVLPSIYKKELLFLIGLSVFKALLDMIGLALIVPLMFNLLNPLNNTPFLQFFGHWPLPFICAVVIVLFILKTLIIYLCSRIQMTRVGNIIAALSAQRLRYFLNKDFMYHKQNHTAWEVRNVTNIPFDFAANILLPYIFLVTETLVLMGISTALCIYKPFICIISAIIMVPFVVIYRRFMRKRLKYFNDIHESTSRLFHFKATEILRAHTDIKLTHTGTYFETQFKQVAARVVKPFTGFNTVNDMASKLLELMAVLGLCVVIIVAIYTHQLHTKVIEFLSVFVLCLSRLLPSINRILSYVNNIRSADFAIDNLVPEDTDTLTKEVYTANVLSFNSHIALKDIYAGFESKLILQGANLNITKGDTIGITGASGAGKTTLLNVLLGLIVPDKGEIYVDTTKITDAYMAQWHQLIGYVPQHVHILAGSVTENIGFGIEQNHIQHKRLKEVAALTGLTDIIQQLPQGWDTILGENGFSLSGGQRQRIAIARAIYHKPSILIFDEATNALDAQAEQDVLQTIQNLQGQCTIIIVAHRASTLKYCHKIYTLINGRLLAEEHV